MKFTPLFFFLACMIPAPIDGGPQASAPRAYRFTNTIDVGEIDEANLLASYIRFRELAESGEKQITLRIDSFGGSIFAGNRWIRAVEDLKKTHGVTVSCVADGSAYSMAAVLLQSAACDLRLATIRSTILFHNGSSGAQGTANDLRKTVSMLDALNLSMALVVSGRIGLSLADYQAKIAASDWVMAAPEALEIGVIDEIVDSKEIAPP